MIETYVLHITRQCNMACAYCYESDKNSEYTWDEIKDTIDSIIKYNTEFNLEFLGGEPCLRVDLIDQTINYLKSKNVKVLSFLITTNGTIVNDLLINILLSNENVFWFASIDGNKFMNSLRVTKDGYNSYDLVTSNLQKLKKAGVPDGQINAHLVTHPYNIAQLTDGVVDLYKQGFRNFGIGTVESTITIDEEYCELFVEQHKVLSDLIKKEKLPGCSIGSFSWLKPSTDSRFYLRDSTGKLVLETYGRAASDIKDTGTYIVHQGGSDVTKLIQGIREAVYHLHNR